MTVPTPDPVEQQGSEHRFATRAVRAGQDADPGTGAVVPPLYQVSTFRHAAVGRLTGGYEYSRAGNPTRAVLESALAALEEGEHGFAAASGLAASDLLLRAVLRPGDHVVMPNDAYGGTYRLIEQVLGAWGVEHTTVPAGDAQAVARAIRPGQTTVVWLETPTNPLLTVADIRAAATATHDAGALLVVDNTFATPYLQRPLVLGADAVVHSTTKYIGGHSDVVGGAVVTGHGAVLPGRRVGPTGDRGLAAAVGFQLNAAGAVAGPFDCWLTLRGLRTLALRMERHCANADAVARWLAGRPEVSQVLYPGLADHPGHDVAAAQMTGFGGMVSVRLGDEAAAIRLVESTRVFVLAESLGGVESLIEHPGRMTHVSVAGTDLAVPDDLVRISVGIEDVADLLADLDQAIA